VAEAIKSLESSSGLAAAAADGARPGLRRWATGAMRRPLRAAAMVLRGLERRLGEVGAGGAAAATGGTWRGGLGGAAIDGRGGADGALTAKYREELEFWNGFVKEGAARQFGAPFAAVYGGWQRARVAELGEFLGLSPEALAGWCAERTAVEIGAGPFPSVAVSRWARAVAVDPLADGYAAEGLLPEECGRVVYVAATGERVPLASAVAHVLVMENALDHVDRPRQVLGEARRLLRPDGLLWLLVDLMEYKDHMHPNPFSEVSLRAMLGEEGFAVVRDRVSDHKSHPQAYGEYRGLLRIAGSAA
jgi:SAM-dependent methyltransferase